MDKDAFFSLLAKWPKITFTHIQIIGPHEEFPAGLYLRDDNVPWARLFCCHVPEGTDRVELRKSCLRWLGEYLHTRSLPVMDTAVPPDSVQRSFRVLRKEQAPVHQIYSRKASVCFW